MNLHHALAPVLFGRTVEAAQEAGECIRCRRPVDLAEMAPMDVAEYRITSLCPACFDEITEPGE